MVCAYLIFFLLCSRRDFELFRFFYFTVEVATVHDTRQHLLRLLFYLLVCVQANPSTSRTSDRFVLRDDLDIFKSDVHGLFPILYSGTWLVLSGWSRVIYIIFCTWHVFLGGICPKRQILHNLLRRQVRN